MLPDSKTPSAPAAAPAGRPLAGKYLLLRSLAQGGMAEVFLAKQIGRGGFEKLVVVKRILPHLAGRESFKTMFLDEARTAALIGHPNVVDILEIGEDEGQLFMVMEFLRGQDASRLFRQAADSDDDVPLHVALQIVIDAGAGLHHAHEKCDLYDRPLRIVHRDVSPQNIIVTYDGVTKILDFGIAAAAGKVGLTEVGQIKGKVCYMSPEQAHGGELDRRSDLFSLGIVLYELTTGVGLFHESSEAESLDAVFRCEVPPPRSFLPQYPKSLEDVVLKALSPTPQGRYDSCDALVTALEEVAAKESIVLSSKRLAQHMRATFAKELARPLFAENTVETPTAGTDEADATGLLKSREERFRRRGPGYQGEHTAATQLMKSTGGMQPPPKPPAKTPRTEIRPAFAAPPAVLSEAEWENTEGAITLGDVEWPGDELMPPPPIAESTMLDGAVVDDAGAPPTAMGAVSPFDLFPDAPDAPGGPFTDFGPAATQSNSFVGRQPELKAVVAAFTAGHRVVVLVGPPGSGKSRLALEATRERATDLLPLHVAVAGARTVDALTAAVAAAVAAPIAPTVEEGVASVVPQPIVLSAGPTLRAPGFSGFATGSLGPMPAPSGTPAPGPSKADDAAGRLDVGAALAGRGPCLLVLDNLESSSAAIECLALWLVRAPALQVLVTSREGLVSPALRVINLEIGPLSLPELSFWGPDAPLLAQKDCEAVQLLNDRARAMRGALADSLDDLRIAVEIAHLLDGLPLALDDVAQEIVRAGYASALGSLCHATEPPFALGVSIDRSWDMLDAAAQATFAQCGVFRGGFSADDAAAVVDLSHLGLSGTRSVQTIVGELRARSLLKDAASTSTEEPRFDLYRPMRVYAEARLRESDLEGPTLERHRAHVLLQAEACAADVEGPGGLTALLRLEDQRENLLAALEHALAQTPGTPALTTAAATAVLALDPLLSIRGPGARQGKHSGAHLELLDKVVRRASVHALPPAKLARLLGARGAARAIRGQLEESRAEYERAIRIARGGGEKALEAWLCAEIADVLVSAGDVEVARAFCACALERLALAPDARVRARVHQAEGRIHGLRAELEQAERSLLSARALFLEQGARRLEGRAVADLAKLTQQSGDPVRARALYEEALALHKETGDRRAEGVSLGALGLLLHQQKEEALGQVCVAEALEILREIGDSRSEALTQQGLGELARAAGDVVEARSRFLAALALHRACGATALAVLVERRLRSTAAPTAPARVF
ncbi:MAG: protein kinase [Deltaproteobacteria bacterium]|nr:protein kinase [Deltaproteobacteria bacterium]